MHLEFLSQSSSRLRRSAEFVFGVRQEQTPQPGKELCCPDCQHQIQPDRRGSSPPSPYAMDRDHHRGKEAKSADKALITFLCAEPPHIPQCHTVHIGAVDFHVLSVIIITFCMFVDFNPRPTRHRGPCSSAVGDASPLRKPKVSKKNQFIGRMRKTQLPVNESKTSRPPLASLTPSPVSHQE